MNIVTRLKAMFGRKAPTTGDLEAEQEANRIAYERDSIRTSQQSSASENYQSGRGSRP